MATKVKQGKKHNLQEIMIHYLNSTHDPHLGAQCIKYDTLYETLTKSTSFVLDHHHQIEHVDQVKWTELCNHDGGVGI